LDNFKESLVRAEKTFEAKTDKINEELVTKSSRDEIFYLKSKFERLAKSGRSESLMYELYAKRMNILIHSLDELDEA